MYLNIVTHSAHDWMKTVTNIKTVDASQVSFGSLEEMQEDSYSGFEFYDCRPIDSFLTEKSEAKAIEVFEPGEDGIICPQKSDKTYGGVSSLFNFPESFVRLEITRENGDFNVVYTNYGAFLCNEVGDTVQRYLVR